jgi:hypothetical protein
MSGFALLPVMTAVVAALKGNAPIVASVAGRIYDQRPQFATLPCIVIGHIDATDWGTKSRAGQECSIPIDVWSMYEGRLECLTIAKLVYDLFHEQSMVSSGVDSFMVRCSRVDVREDAEGSTRSASIKLRILALSTT